MGAQHGSHGAAELAKTLPWCLSLMGKIAAIILTRSLSRTDWSSKRGLCVHTNLQEEARGFGVRVGVWELRSPGAISSPNVMFVGGARGLCACGRGGSSSRCPEFLPQKSRLLGLGSLNRRSIAAPPEFYLQVAACMVFTLIRLTDTEFNIWPVHLFSAIGAFFLFSLGVNPGIQLWPDSPGRERESCWSKSDPTEPVQAHVPS